MPSAESYASQVHKEQRWLPFLGNQLSTQIPRVQGLGKPGHDYPWPWSVYKWIDGEDIEPDTETDANGLANSIAHFISELHAIDTSDGPAPGLHNYYRGGNLGEYDKDMQEYVELLINEICSDDALNIWSKALETQWTTSPVWVHGDLEASNILVSGGQLAAVIDFGNCTVGDPACDLVMAWTFFDEKARNIFRSNLKLDNDTWVRARAWALWKALFRMSKSLRLRDEEFYNAKCLVENILSTAT